MPKLRAMPSDDVIRHAVEHSHSFEEAASRVGLSKTCVRRHASRLGVRTRFLYGKERLPSDVALKAMLVDASKGKGMAELARRLGVTRKLLSEEASRLGVDGRVKVGAGLPADVTLLAELQACERFLDVAQRYGVLLHTVRNQARRLGVPSPSKRDTSTRVRPEDLAVRAYERGMAKALAGSQRTHQQIRAVLSPR